MLSATFEILENRTFGAGVALAMRDEMREAAAHRAQLGDLAIERLEVRGGERLYRPARALLVAPKIEQPAYLVDGVAGLQPEWFEDVNTVLITAGASAPEVVVQECVEFLRTRFGATVDEITIRHEDVHFQVPRELRTLQLAAEA